MRRALATLSSAVLVIVLLFSPAAESAVRFFGDQRVAAPRSVRLLNYELNDQRQRGLVAYQAVLRGTPSSISQLYVMGSSEFGTDVDQNAARFLARRVNDVDMFVSGRGYTGSLYHAIELGAVSRTIPNKKVALIVSPQWFTPQGMSPPAYEATFSDSEFQAMLASPALSDGLKARIVARAGQLKPELCSVRYPCGASGWQKARLYLDAPYAALANRVNVLQEEYQARRVNQNYAAPYTVGRASSAMASLDWDAEREVARANGEKNSTNEFGMSDNFYNRWIQPRLAALRGSQAADTYMASPEFGDLELFLDVARESRTEVLLVSVPVNGRWYDYTGFPIAERDGYYAKIRAIAAAHQVRLADLSTNEDTPYYFWDTWHLGWRGWLDVDEVCYDFVRN